MLHRKPMCLSMLRCGRFFCNLLPFQLLIRYYTDTEQNRSLRFAPGGGNLPEAKKLSEAMTRCSQILWCIFSNFHKASQCFLSGRGLLKANRQNRQSIKILKETQKDGNSPPCFHPMHYGFRAMGAVTSRVSELCLLFSPHPNFSYMKMSTLWKTSLHYFPYLDIWF